MRPPYHVQVLNNATVNATGAVGGGSFDNPSNAPAPTLTAYLRIANAPTGTSPSMTLKLQSSPDGVNWADVPSGAFAAQTAATAANTSIRLSVSNLIDPFLQVVATVTGTTPSFTGVTLDLFFSSDS